jgi:transglutaminase/protease-like cytokinesis protein 3
MSLLEIRLFLTVALLAFSGTGCGKAITTDIPSPEDNATVSAQWVADHEVQPKDPEIQALADQITQGQTAENFKMVLIHNWVAMHIRYDDELWGQIKAHPTATLGLKDYDDSVATNVLHTRKAVCLGYAALTSSLLIAAGIPAKMVSGTVTNALHPCDHIWNKAFVDGKWIILDTTWDAGNTGSSCINDYLNPEPSFFAQSHEECGESSGN